MARKARTRKITRRWSVRRKALLRRLFKRLAARRFRLALGRRKRAGYYYHIAASPVRKRGGYPLRRYPGIPWSGRYGNYRLKTIVRRRIGRRYRTQRVIITNAPRRMRRNPGKARKYRYRAWPFRRGATLKYAIRKALRRNPATTMMAEIKALPSTIQETFRGNIVRNTLIATASAVGTAMLGAQLAGFGARAQSPTLQRILGNRFVSASIPLLLGVTAAVFIKNRNVKAPLVTGALAATVLNLVYPTWFAALRARLMGRPASGVSGYADAPAYAGAAGYADAPAYAGAAGYADAPAYAGAAGYADAPAYAGAAGYADAPAYAGTGEDLAADDMFSADELASDELASDDLASDELAEDLASEELADDTVLTGLGSYLADSLANSGSYLS